MAYSIGSKLASVRVLTLHSSTADNLVTYLDTLVSLLQHWQLLDVLDHQTSLDNCHREHFAGVRPLSNHSVHHQ